MRKIMPLTLAAAAAFIVAGCGERDLGGYADQNEACKSLGASVTQGPVREGDEEEYVCSNGRVVETKYFGPNRDEKDNTWFVDEDTQIDPETGEESCRGEECVGSGEAASGYIYEDDE